MAVEGQAPRITLRVSAGDGRLDCCDKIIERRQILADIFGISLLNDLVGFTMRSGRWLGESL
jgi:hypothetical protein